MAKKPLPGIGKGAIFESREAVLFHALGADCYSPFLLAGARKIPSKLLVALKCKIHSEQTSETWNSKALPKRAKKVRTRREQQGKRKTTEKNMVKV